MGARARGAEVAEMIRQLPLLPEWTYLHTCPLCRGHVPPTRLGWGADGESVLVCGWCRGCYVEMP